MVAKSLSKQVFTSILKRLVSLFDIAKDEIKISEQRDLDIDLIVTIENHRFALCIMKSTSVGLITISAQKLVKATKQIRGRVIPVLVVPFMGSAGQKACSDTGVQWFDLSGNAYIIAPGLRITVEGKPNQFRNVGRPASIFAPKSARIARHLLMYPHGAFTQREIAQATHLTDGLVSRIVTRLEAEEYVLRVGEKCEGSKPVNRLPLRVRDAHLLLEAWREEYHFEKHTLIQGHVAARSGEELIRIVNDAMNGSGIKYAMTGLSAAWLFNHFASFRLATFFVEEDPTDFLKEKIGFRDDTRGANLWLVVPNDTGIFEGVENYDAVPCVHPVQVYLDLKSHPERSKEAADHLRGNLFIGGHDA